MSKQQVIHNQKKNEQPKTKSRFVNNGLLLSTGGKVWHVKGEQRYLVQSNKDTNRFYDVKVNDNGMECSCEDFQRYSSGVCKHVYAVLNKEIGR